MILLRSMRDAWWGISGEKWMVRNNWISSEVWGRRKEGRETGGMVKVHALIEKINIWVSLHPMSKFLLYFQFSPTFFLTVWGLVDKKHRYCFLRAWGMRDERRGLNGEGRGINGEGPDGWTLNGEKWEVSDERPGRREKCWWLRVRERRGEWCLGEG